MSKDKKGGNRVVTAAWMIFFGIIFGIVASVVFILITIMADRLVVPLVNEKLMIGNPQVVTSTPDPVKQPASAVIVNNPDDNTTGTNEDLFAVIDDYLGNQNKMTVVEVAKKCMSSIVAINITIDYNYDGYQTELEGAGSGIIVGQNDSELLIATNYHVVEDNKTLKVQFCDGEIADGTVKGKKVSMDLAVVAVDLSNISEDTKKAITMSTIGDSDSLVVGEEVVAIGNAMGYGQSVTYGVVSALKREMTVPTGEKGLFIQTDAAINPGNSGGALFNMNGELIGINSNKLGGNDVEGMGYSIPINEAIPIINNLMNIEALVALPEEEQSYMGITGGVISEYTTTNDGTVIPRGVYIQEVVPGGTADMAGLKRGDIITEFNGDSIVSMNELKNYLAAVKKGTKAKITYRRYDGTEYGEYEVEVVLQGKQ